MKTSWKHRRIKNRRKVEREKESSREITGFCKSIMKSPRLTAEKVKAILTLWETQFRLPLRSNDVLNNSKLYCRFGTGDKRESQQDWRPTTSSSEKSLCSGPGWSGPYWTCPHECHNTSQTFKPQGAGEAYYALTPKLTLGDTHYSKSLRTGPRMRVLLNISGLAVLTMGLPSLFLFFSKNFLLLYHSISWFLSSSGHWH